MTKRRFRFDSASARLLLVTLSLLFNVVLLYADTYRQYIKLGNDHVSLSQFDKARDFFEKAVALEPNQAEGYVCLGKVLASLNRLEEAVEKLEKAVDLDPEDSDTRRSLGGIYIKFSSGAREAGNRTAMLDYLHKACIAYPNQSKAWRALLNYWFQDKLWDEIIAAGDTIRSANRRTLETGDDKDLQEVMIILAKACYQRKDMKKAQEFLKLAGMIRHTNDEIINLSRQLSQDSKQIAAEFREKAGKLFEQKKYKEAAEFFKKADEAQPGDHETADMLEKSQKKAQAADFIALAKTSESKGKFQEALDSLNRAKDFDPDDTQLQVHVASITAYIEAVKEEESKKYTEELAKRHRLQQLRKEFEQLMKSAAESEAKEEYSIALMHYEKAQKMQPKKTEIADSIERVKNLRTKAEERRKNYLDNFANAGKLIEDKNYSKALDVLQKLFADPKNPRDKTFPMIIDLHIKLEQWDEAQKLNNEWIEKGADKDKSNYFAGSINYYKGNYDQAWEKLTPIFSKDPDFTPELKSMIWKMRYEKYKVGIFLTLFFLPFVFLPKARKIWANFRRAKMDAMVNKAIESGDYQSIIPILEKRLDDGGYLENRRQLTIALAEAYLKQGKYQNAYQRAKEILQKDSRNATARRIIGECCFRLNDNSSEAIESIYNLFLFDETRKDLLSYLMDFFRSQQADHKQAVEIYSKQVALCPDDNETVIFLANLFVKRKTMNDFALKILKRAVKIAPDDQNFALGYINALRHSGNNAEADDAEEKALQKWPDFCSSVTVSKPDPTPAAEKMAEKKVISTNVSSDVPDSAQPAENTIICANCGTSNSTREYYCGKCGKHL